MKRGNFEFKSCFGAVAAYTKGKIFASCGKFGFALKLPNLLTQDLLEERGVKHLKYFSNGHVKKDVEELIAILPFASFRNG